MTHRIDPQFILAGFALAGTLAFAVPVRAQADQQALMSASREASTAREHADLARRFRLQAEAFDATAAEREAAANRIARQAPGMLSKWPAMAPPALAHAKQQALDARRSAQESRTMADRHLRLAVEAQADPTPVGE
jgi:hypothetical protein